MNKWTEEQIEEINNSYWRKPDEPPTCPLCGGNVRVDIDKVLGRYPKDMIGHCVSCDARASFKSWHREEGDFTSEQIKDFVHLHQRGESCICPNDGALLEVNPQHRIGAKTTYSILCPRCGASGQTE